MTDALILLLLLVVIGLQLQNRRLIKQQQGWQRHNQRLLYIMFRKLKITGKEANQALREYNEKVQ